MNDLVINMLPEKENILKKNICILFKKTRLHKIFIPSTRLNHKSSKDNSLSAWNFYLFND